MSQRSPLHNGTRAIEKKNDFKKVQVGTDQEMALSERNSHFINRGVEETKMTLRYLYQENISYTE